MPQIFKFGGYIIFFWSNENKPTEPIHVHIAKHNPRANSTKVWITKRGKTLVCNNNSQIRKLYRNGMNILTRLNIIVNIYEIRYCLCNTH